jgi:nucleoside-diphosphate-sugar epimerase
VVHAELLQIRHKAHFFGAATAHDQIDRRVSAMASTLLLTGASGFVGRALARFLIQQKNLSVRCAGRRTLNIDGADNVIVPTLDSATDWSIHLSGIKTVIHCAARVHVMHETATDPFAQFRQINVDGTMRLAEQAAQAGVQQFIFLSSVKVNGEQTELGRPFKETDTPCPLDAYGISKYEAEQALLALSDRCNMAVTIIRPPLIYGAGVGANFKSLMQVLKKGVPLPLASIRNLRSFVYLGNLLDFIAHCIDHPSAMNQTFLISDGFDMSTPALLHRGAQAFNRPARLFPFSPAFLTLLAQLIGRKSMADRLCQCLQVDISKARKQLDWQAPFSVTQGIQETANALLSEAQHQSQRKN